LTHNDSDVVSLAAYKILVVLPALLGERRDVALVVASDLSEDGDAIRGCLKTLDGI